MQDPEIQRELLREILEPPQALILAVNMELGQRNQLQISNTQSTSRVNAIIPQRLFANQFNGQIPQLLIDSRINYAVIVA